MPNISFADEEETNYQKEKYTYKILIVDDDQSVHDITNMTLKAMNFTDFTLEVLNALSASEAREIFKEHDDIALALIDVVMETPEAGLELVDHIRNDLNNSLIRLIIRTGQASEYPPMDVVQHYDINDFKEKTELTLERLYTSIRSTIKQYRQLIELEEKYQQTYKQMTTNSLTKLPNRTKLYEDCNDAKNHTLILIDIVGFSSINENKGYEVGDYVLRELGGFLQTMYGEEYKVYHLDSDLFALIASHEKLKDLEASVEEIKSEISKLKIVTKNFNSTIDTTIGVAHESDNSLMRKAELALKEARNIGKNKIKYYSDDLKIIKRLNDTNYWGPIIKDGLDNGNVLAYYQPIIEISSGEIAKYELLMRINYAGHIHAPAKFLDAARHSGQLYDIFCFMFEKACEQAKITGKKFSVNIGDSEFLQEGLIDFIKGMIEKYSVDTSCLSLEILEYASITTETEIKDEIMQIYQLGIEIVIDDFGTQCSNFGQIENLPIDVIKIDGSFIKDLPDSEDSQIIVKTIKTFAKEKGIKLVAEYVCDEVVFNAVKKFELDYAQGYYLGEPKETL